MEPIKPVISENENYTVVSFLVSKESWQQQRDITGYSDAEKFAANEYRRYNVYKVKIYDSRGTLAKELV